MTAAECVTSLRELADWMEQNETLLDEQGWFSAMSPVNWYANDKNAVVAVVRRLGAVSKEYTESLFWARRKFGHVQFDAVCSRDQVCRKVETLVEKTSLVPDPAVQVPMVEVTETVTQVEWICDEPLLRVAS